MANDDEISARGGLLPVNFPYGNYRKNLYQLTTGGAASDVFIGQPMDLDGLGRVIPAGAGSDGSFMIGPVVGFTDINKAGLPGDLYDLNQGGFLQGNNDAFVWIADDPNQLFSIQADTGGTEINSGNMGNSAHVVPRSSSGNTTTGYSTFELDSDSSAADDSGSLHIVGLVDKMNSDGTPNTYADFGKILVSIMWHRLQHSGSQEHIAT